MRAKILSVPEAEQRLVECLVALADAIDNDPNAALFEDLEYDDIVA